MMKTGTLQRFFATLCAILCASVLLSACGGGTGGSGESTPGGGSGDGGSDSPTLDYPSRTIEFVVPFGAGGSADMFARSFADLVSQETGTNVNVVNKEGAGGVTGLTYVSEQEADGYTFCLVTPSMPIAEAKGRFDFSGSFTPIAMMEADVYVVSVLDSNKNFTDWDGFVSYAKANPGVVTTGGSSAGGLDEYTALQFGEAIGAELTYVPYDGYGEYKTAFLGGEVDLYIDKLSSFTGMAQYEEIIPLLVTSENRVNSAGLDDTPTSSERGIEFGASSWRGIVVKTGTSQEIVDYLSGLCERIYGSEDFQSVLKQDSADVVFGYKNAADFTAHIASETERFADIVAAYGD